MCKAVEKSAQPFRKPESLYSYHSDEDLQTDHDDPSFKQFDNKEKELPELRFGRPLEYVTTVETFITPVEKRPSFKSAKNR